LLFSKGHDGIQSPNENLEPCIFSLRRAKSEVGIRPDLRC
jgi:hypothetical protein